MNILVTGAQGFIGRNLVETLKNKENYEVFEIDRETEQEKIKEYLKIADFIFHLAGVNRTNDQSEFMEGNKGLIVEIVEQLESLENYPPILFTSSIQATLENPYGKSKRAGENVVLDYAKNNNIDSYVYRLPNLFGKWSRPNYNSVIATFCHNISRGKEIQINNPSVELTLAYIDDVIDEFIAALNGKAHKKNNYYSIPVRYEVQLGEIADLLYSFKESRNNRMIPDMSNKFIKKLYSTYLSYLPKEDFSYPLLMHEDERGSFTEFVKSPEAGQVSINVSKEGITKGDHWHHTKNEKFLVVKGEGLIRFREIGTEEIIEYKVSDKKLEVVDIPVGYTHSIVNTGKEDMVTVMWVNELFDPNHPDTYSLEV